MSPEGDQAYFSDGITEEILNTLARVRELKVAARTSAFAFKDRQLDLRAVGDSLGVAYLIEGSVRKAGDRLRITAQLIDASDGTHLWSDSYDRTMDDVFAIQTEIAEAIARELRVPLGLDDPNELVTPTADLEAFDLYLAGRARIRERGASLREAVRLFEAAISRDSTWAPAWAALAEAHELRSWYTAAWDEEPEDDDAYNATVARHHAAAEVAAQRALAIDPDIPTARVALGSVYRNRRQWEAAEREYLRALAIDPDNAEAHQQYSEMLGDVGRIDRAVAAAERAVRLDPAPIRRLQFGAVLWADDRATEARGQLREGIDLDPQNHVPQLRNNLYLMELASGYHDELATFDLPPDLPVTPEQHARLVQAMRAGDKSLMPSEFAEISPVVVVTWAAFGDRERALEAIERWLIESPGGVLVWLWLPHLDALREDPRFREILELVNLGDAVLERTPR
jgi:TolB-like protein